MLYLRPLLGSHRTESDKGSGNTMSQSHFTPSYQCHQTPLALMQCTKQLLGVPKLLMHQSVLGVQCWQRCKSCGLGHWSPLQCSRRLVALSRLACANRAWWSQGNCSGINLHVQSLSCNSWLTIRTIVVSVKATN